MAVQLTNNTFYELIRAALKNPNTNMDIVIQMIFSTLNESSIKGEYFLYLLTAENAELLNKHDYFKCVPEKYDVNSKFTYDQLKDLGLLSEDNMVYGKVLDDDGWSSDYDPFYGRVKVEMFYHTNDGKKLETYSTTINT